MIPFNKPYLGDMELSYIQESIASGKISGDGIFTKKCHDFFEKRYGFQKTLLTTSCTDALEMASILCNIEPGDEVIAPSFTFVSTVNPFILRGAKIVFADSEPTNPNMDVANLESLITPKTKVIVPVHYAGVACNMDVVLDAAAASGIIVVEDAAQAIDSYYKGRPLGSLGQLATFSFHETKNVISGEGGMLAINNKTFEKRAEIIREKGTNRSAFFRGEVNKYGWVDIGSSFLPSDINAAYLYAQLENIDLIQNKRKSIWFNYFNGLVELERRGDVLLPNIPNYASNNAHMFYLICPNLLERTRLMRHLNSKGIHAVFHYLSLHSSPYYHQKHDRRSLPNADRFSDCLLRLPMYFELKPTDQERIICVIKQYFGLC